VVAPVEDPVAQREVQHVIDLQLADTSLAWRLEPDGSWARLADDPGAGEPLNSQDALLEHARRERTTG